MEESTETTPNESEQTPEARPAVQTTIEDKSQGSAKLAGDEVLFGTLSYFNIAVLATIVTKPNSEFCHFHARQGVTLVILDLALIVVVSLAMVIVPFFAILIFFIGVIALFVLHILGIIHSIQGKMYRLPIIYGLSQKIDITQFFAAKKTQPTPVQEQTAPTEEQPPQIQPQAEPQPQPETTPQPGKPQLSGQDMVDRAVDTLSEEKRNRQ